MMTWTCCGLAILMAAACAPVGLATAEAPLRDLTRENLVSRLAVEGPMAAEARFSSSTAAIFDDVVGEILRRRDPEIVPLLIARINDDTVVEFPEGTGGVLGRYGTPVRVKYKVRFILKHLLQPVDYSALVPDSSVVRVDEDAARRYYEANREAIAKRIRAAD